MPRLQPPQGYLTAKDAAARLGVSDALLSRYVNEGKLHRYGPPERKHKFYKVSEIEALRETERLFGYQPGAWREHPSSTFELATEDDMPAMDYISASVAGASRTPMELRLARLHKNPESYHVLRNQDGVVVGYACILCMKEETIKRFIRGEINTPDITADEVESFETEYPVHIYLMALCVTPDCTHMQKRMYGARLVSGLFTFLFELASRGVQIETITARSWTNDGIRLLRHMNIPQLRSPVPGKNLFSVHVADSGIPLLVKYSELLEQWKREHS